MPDMDIKIVNSYPPNFDLIKTMMPHANETHTYCYGDTIYVPDGHTVPPDIVFHESIHTKQQGKDPDAWWHRFVTDPDFRLEQEIQAYGEQYKWVREHVMGARFQKWVLENMAKALSGHAYGDLISYAKAESAIRNYRKHS